MIRATVHGWFTESAPLRRAAEAILRVAGRHHLARLDRRDPSRCQRRILRGLLHQAQSTRFGREHDFCRIRTAADFRRLVPLRTRAELWRDYWQPAYPRLEGVTWPGTRANGQADGDSLRLTPPSAALIAAHRSALRTALALACHARRGAPLLAGHVLVLSDDGPFGRFDPAALAQRLPALVRPFATPAAEVFAEQWARRPVSCLVGPAERLRTLAEEVKQVSGRRCLRDVWPGLSAVLYTQRPPAHRLRDVVGEDVLLLEMVGRAEGPIAVHDPRHGAPRLLCDHGLYFEFVPVGRADEPGCPRCGVDEMELGVPYELIVTSPAGLWACRVGRTVRLERRDPPLVRFLEPAAPAAKRPARRTDLAQPTLAPPAARPQSADSPAAPPESSYRSPWSTLADRG